MTTVEQILKSLGDEIALELFLNNASKETTNPANGKKLSRKQYYTRLSKIVKSGLLKRVGSRYHRTSSGDLMVKAIDLMQRAINNEAALRAYDVLRMQNGIDDLAARLIKDPEIIEILGTKRGQDGVVNG